MKPPYGADVEERVRENEAHWVGTAAAHGAKHDASWKDGGAMELEFRNLLPFVRAGDRVLDAGCANGYTTFRLLCNRPSVLHAFDTCAPMIAAARKAAAACDSQGRISFYRADIREIPEPAGDFDLVYAIRVLINLPDWGRQRRAIREMHRVLKPGGCYFLSEAFEGSQRNLNRLRDLAGLPPLRSPSFNLYLEEKDLEGFVSEFFEIERILRFSSAYYVATRFLRDLTLRGDEPPDYDSPVHRLARDFPFTDRNGDFGIQKAYVLRKK